MKEGFVFAAGGGEPFIREVGWGEEHFRQGLVIFHKSIHFVSVICPKTACKQKKSFFWFVRFFFGRCVPHWWLGGRGLTRSWRRAR